MLSKIITDRYNGELVDLLMHMLEYTHDGLLTIDEKQDIVMFNSGAERIFGYTTEEVMDKSLLMLLPQRVRDVHQGHVKKFDETHSAVCDASIVPSSDRKMLSGVRKNGEEFPCEVTITKIHFKGHVYFTAAIEDVSLRIQHEKELAEKKINKRAELILQVTESD